MLVTHWIDGTPLACSIASGTQDDRDRCGTALVRPFTSGPARARRLQETLHPATSSKWTTSSAPPNAPSGS